MSNHKGKYKNEEIETLSSKLKFISKLQPGQKISVSTGAIQDNTYWTSMARSFSGENRSKAYRFISDVIKDSLSILESLSNSSNEYDIQICRNLITDLICLKPGLDNLQSTYTIDKMYVSKVQTLIENLDVKIHEICNKREEINFEDLFEDAQEKMAQLMVEDYEDEGDCCDQEDEDQDENQEEDGQDEDQGEDEDQDEDEDEGQGEDESQKKKSELVDEELDQIPEVVETEPKVCSIEPPKINFIQQHKDESVCHGEPTGSSYPIENYSPEESDFSSYLKTLPSEDLLLMTTSEKVQPKGRAGRKKRKKHSYQYDTYYMSPPDDITLCNVDVEKGIIR